MKSTITLFKHLPLITGNYIIDDIDSYLEQYKNQSLVKDIDIVYINDYNDVFLNFDLSLLDSLYQYNYAKITSDKLKTAYYFITNIEKAANNNLKFSLELDVLNTFQNLEFYANTHVKREHIDRWNYKGFYYNKERNKIYLLRNFIKEQDTIQKMPLTLIDSFSIYTDTSSILLDKNYWIKLVVKGENDGIKIYFLNLYYDFDLAAGDTYIIKGFTNYSNKDIAVLCLSSGTIIDGAAVPYCPHSILKNVGEDSLIIPTTEEYSKIFNVGTLEFLDEKGEKHIFTGVSTTFYSSLLSLSSLDVPLYKLANQNKQLFFTEFLYNVLIQEINNADVFIKEIKQNTLLNNGVFSDNHEEERDINNFYQTNEPSTLQNNNCNIILFNNDLNVNHNLILENIKLKDNINFSDFCNQIDSSNVYDNLILLPFNKLYYDKNGGSILIKDSDYFYYKGFKKDGIKYIINATLPFLSSDAIQFDKESDLRRLQNISKTEEIKQDETVEANPSIFRRSMNFLSDKAQIAQDFIKKNVPKNIQQGVKRGFNTLIRTGSPIKSLLTAGSASILAQEAENNRNNFASTTFEAFITHNEFKINLDVKLNEKMNSLEDVYYYTGNAINVDKIPTHNNRKYFDYLECEPYFKTYIDANSDIKEKIIDHFNLGVYYIHKVIDNKGKNVWVFPFENVENLENKLISLL